MSFDEYDDIEIPEDELVDDDLIDPATQDHPLAGEYEPEDPDARDSAEEIDDAQQRDRRR